MSESQQIEYKRAFSKEVIISLVAFANSDGGKVIVGKEDAGTVCGVEVGPETVQRYLNEIKVATYPQLLPKISLTEFDGKKVLTFEIGEFPVKPVSYKNRYYKRFHNSNHVMSLEEIVAQQQHALSLSYDAYPSNVAMEALDAKLIEDFFEKVARRGRASFRDDLVTNFTKLKLLRDGKLTIAANLLFGDPDCSIRIGRFKSEATIIDDIVVKSPLFRAVDETLVFIKKHINLSYHFNGDRERKERWQYPLEALRELVLNAVVHRDYKNISDIVVKIFDERIIISNPGKLYGNLNIMDLKRDDYVSALRNRLLAEAFFLTGDIERYGTGFVRIRENLQSYPDVELNLEEMGDFFKAELRHIAPPITPPITPPIITRDRIVATDLEFRILRLLHDQPRLSASNVAALLQIRRDTVKEYIARLKAKGLLLREGGARGGIWRVTADGAGALGDADR